MWLLLACAAPSPVPVLPSPPPDAPESPPSDLPNRVAEATLTTPLAIPRPTEDWRLSGRSRAGRVEVPPLPELGSGLPAPCAPDAPGDCLVELWVREGAGEGEARRVYARAGKRARWYPTAGEAPRPVQLPPPTLARASWRTLGQVLGACLPDPLIVPAAGDPGATRGYDGKEWVLAFSGAGPCGLDGTLRLSTEDDRVHTALLLVDGKPWSRGGRERAELRLRAYVAAHPPPPETPSPPRRP